MNCVSCAVHVKMTIDNEIDYDKGGDTMNFDTWILHSAFTFSLQLICTMLSFS